jgi:hypothetical protein
MVATFVEMAKKEEPFGPSCGMRSILLLIKPYSIHYSLLFLFGPLFIMADKSDAML